MLSVQVYSAHRTVADGLACLVRSLGHRVLVTTQPVPDPRADVAVWDLTSRPRRIPTPGRAPTIALTAGGERERIRLLVMGYRGYLHPQQDASMLARAIRAVAAGELWAERRVLAASPRNGALTARERQVLDLLTKGLTNREIARELGIAEKTVSVHVSSLLRKCSARSRIELLVLASEAASA